MKKLILMLLSVMTLNVYSNSYYEINEDFRLTHLRSPDYSYGKSKMKKKPKPQLTPEQQKAARIKQLEEQKQKRIKQLEEQKKARLKQAANNKR